MSFFPIKRALSNSITARKVRYFVLSFFRRRVMFKMPGLILAGVLMTAVPAPAQLQTQDKVDSRDPRPTFNTAVVSRTTPAVSYRHRSGATKINFKSTDLMPG